jgi:predicted MPP superfamily phosphohydrolase
VAGPLASLAQVSESPSAAPPRAPSRRVRTAGRWATRVLVTLTGAALGVLLLGRIDAPIGPFDAQLSFQPSIDGGAELGIPPLGALTVDAYDGPLRLDIQLRRIDQVRAQTLATDPAQLERVVDEVNADLRDAVTRLVWTTAGAAVLGATVTSLVLYRRRQEPLIAAGLSVLLLAGTGGVGALTWRPEALSQPTYTGLLVNANSLIGSAEDIVARFDAYRASLEDIVGNVSTLYATISALPEPATGDPNVATLLHVSDIHLNPAGFDLVEQIVGQFEVDAVLDTGDITDWGSQPETQLITSIGDLPVPYVFIRGNHDSAVTAAVVGSQQNATVLDHSDVVVDGVRIVGAPDPRFTPDKSTGDDGAGDEELLESGEELAAFAGALDPPAAIAMVHDPTAAGPLDGVVPTVLAGHTHDRQVTQLDDGTLLMVQGSTGGAGLRALEGEYPEPLTCTVLYVDRVTGALTAYDEITLGGLGLTEATIQRTVVERPDDESADGGAVDADPGPGSADGIDQAEEAGNAIGGADGETTPAPPASPTG